MTGYEKALVAPVTSIREAIRAINDSALQVALIVDERRRLLGVVTDGDIRNGLLNNVGLDDPVSRIMTASPTTVPPGTGPVEALRIMRAKRLRHLPVVDASRRIEGLLFYDDLQGPEPMANWVVIMAGGRGTRLRPLTDNLPKPMLFVGDRPLLESIIRSFAEQGFSQFFISVNYLSSVIESHFGDGSTLGVEIRYLRETRQLGTAGALALLPEVPSRPIIVMNGDLLTTVRFRNILQFHLDKGADVTICVRGSEHKVPFGVADIVGHRVVKLREKPVLRYAINAGIYVLDPKVISDVRSDVPLNMPELLQRSIDRGERVVAFPLQEYWIDIGHMAELDRANAEYSDMFENQTAGTSGTSHGEES